MFLKTIIKIISLRNILQINFIVRVFYFKNVIKNFEENDFHNNSLFLKKVN